MNNKKDILRFAVPSILGLVLFLFPIPTDGGFTIAIAVIAGKATEIMMPAMHLIVYTLIFVSALGALITKLFKPEFILKHESLKALFDVSNIWVAVRVLGGIIAFMCLINKGPEIFTSPDTGQFLIDGLLVYWIGTILVAGTLMDLLLNYGLMEFVGTFLSKIMRPIFKVPGRCAIDCLASWMGDAVVGIIITTDQYQSGYYSKREAAIISTTFSAVSISFTLLVVMQLGLSDKFLPFFLVTLATGMICGIIMPRIWPFRKMKDDYYVEGKIDQDDENNKVSFKRAVEVAVERSKTATLSPIALFKKGVKTSVECAIVCMPTVMLIGTISLILSYFTPLFTWLGVPFEPILNLLQVPESQAASECMLAGFGDMFIPSILASSNIQSEFTRFFVGVLSITQLIYMSEVGALLLSSKLPLSLKDLLIIFLERTVICIPVIIILLNVFVY